MSDASELRDLEQRQQRAKEIATDIDDLIRAVPKEPDEGLELRVRRALKHPLQLGSLIACLSRIQRSDGLPIVVSLRPGVQPPRGAA